MLLQSYYYRLKTNLTYKLSVKEMVYDWILESLYLSIHFHIHVIDRTFITFDVQIENGQKS